MLPYIVVDASVAGAWLFAETFSPQAQVVLDAIDARRVTALAPDRFLEELLWGAELWTSDGRLSAPAAGKYAAVRDLRSQAFPY